MGLLFTSIEEVEMPNLNHCVECDKPIVGEGVICDFCKGDGELTTADKFNYEWIKALNSVEKGKCIQCDGTGEEWDGGMDGLDPPVQLTCSECHGVGKINENM